MIAEPLKSRQGIEKMILIYLTSYPDTTPQS